jgi:hypothetical protein
MKILITERQLKKILLEIEDPPVNGKKEDPPSIKTKDYWDPKKNCVGCKTENGFKTNIVKVSSGKENGRNIELTSDSAPYYEKMVDRMNADGLYFKSASGYRPYKTQFDIVDWTAYEDSVKNVNISTYRDAKKIGTWQTKSNVQGKPAKVAVPGTSNHGKGHAVDVDGCSGCGYSDAQNWVRKNGEVYGWWWGEVPSENWHFTFKPDDYPPNEYLINLMEELEGDIDIANTVMEREKDPKFAYYDYCLRVIKLDKKGMSLLGKSTLPPNVITDDVKEYCKEILRVDPLPIKKIELIKSKNTPTELQSDDPYSFELFKYLISNNLNKSELRKKIKQLKRDNREDLIYMVKTEIKNPGYYQRMMNQMKK